MTADVIQGIRFKKLEAEAPVVEILRDIGIDMEEQGEDAKKAEIFAVVRFADGTFDVWTSATTSLLTRIGELEAIKQHLLLDIPLEEV